jgi:hypothetical protein
MSNTREHRSAYRILVGNPAGNRLLERRWRGWEDNIKNYLKGKRWEGVVCLNLVHDKDDWMALVNTAMNLRIP